VGAGRAVERKIAERTMFGSSTYFLLRGKLFVASGEDASGEAQSALAGFRESGAPWWVAKSLRLLGTTEALAEAAELERALGIPGSLI
jgi:hypothetical protein